MKSVSVDSDKSKHKNLVISVAILAAIVVLLVAGCAYTYLQSRKTTIRIAYVDTAILVRDFSESKKARTELESFNKDWERKAHVMKDSMNAYMEMVGGSFNASSEAKKEEFNKGMQVRNQEMERFIGVNQKKSMDKEKELMDPVLSKINLFMDDYAKKNKLDLIMGSTNSGNILAGSVRLNITSDVLNAINKQYP